MGGERRGGLRNEPLGSTARSSVKLVEKSNEEINRSRPWRNGKPTDEPGLDRGTIFKKDEDKDSRNMDQWGGWRERDQILSN